MSEDVKNWLDNETAKVVEKRIHISEAYLIGCLRTRYAGNSYAFFPHVRDATGYGAARTADALVMGLWPSRGLELEGFEIKISRTDWQKELKTPEKAEAICQYCDRWWLVVGDDNIVKEGELPPTWGLMVHRKGRLFVKQQAPKLKPVDLDRGFIASIMRKATEGMISKSEINTELEKKYKDGYERGKTEISYEASQMELKELKKGLEAFKKASGIDISSWNGQRMGELVKFFMEQGTDTAVNRIKRFVDELKRSLKYTEESLKRIEEEANGLPDEAIGDLT